MNTKLRTSPVVVPAGFSAEMPRREIAFLARLFSEPTLSRLASAYEREATRRRLFPTTPPHPADLQS